MNDKALKFLGLLYAGKQLSIGDTAKLDIKRNKSKLVIVAIDASEETKKEIVNACLNNNVNITKFGLKSELAGALGKGNVAVISINSAKAAKAFLEKI